QASKVAQGLWGAGQMMFNKYLIIVPADADVRNTQELACRIRNANLTRDLIRSEGILDVLDHATATLGFGGKLALDLTGVQPTSEAVNADDSHAMWGVKVAYADPDAEVATPSGSKYFAIFDSSAQGLTGEELLWLAAANTDPRRDVSLCGETLRIDARSKRPAVDGHPSRFPNVVTALPETIDLVDRRWAAYAIGEFIESPSRRYRALLHSEKEAW
ncbi:MAG: UbiD family decarboxylase, partial [Alistipes sp.]